jgi:xylulose-5-phosphate/fructose-6-phosphate phosphoketolase
MPTEPTLPTPQQLDLMDAYWRAANYLSVGQIYLADNPLLKRPLVITDMKPCCWVTGAPRQARTSSTFT